MVTFGNIKKNNYGRRYTDTAIGHLPADNGRRHTYRQEIRVMQGIGVKRTRIACGRSDVGCSCGDGADSIQVWHRP